LSRRMTSDIYDNDAYRTPPRLNNSFDGYDKRRVTPYESPYDMNKSYNFTAKESELFFKPFRGNYGYLEHVNPKKTVPSKLPSTRLLTPLRRVARYQKPAKLAPLQNDKSKESPIFHEVGHDFARFKEAPKGSSLPKVGSGVDKPGQDNKVKKGGCC